MSITAESFPRVAGRTQYDAVPAKMLPVTFPYNERPIRTGGYSDVYRGVYRGTDVAVKRLRPVTEDDDEYEIHNESVWKEVQIMMQLQHENILALWGLCTLAFEICLVSPWVPESMTLLKFLKKERNANRHLLLSNVAAALAYLHGKLDSSGAHLVHGDLHEKNVLIRVDPERIPSPGYRALLCDFGLSKIIPAGHDASNSFHGGVRAGVILAPELQPTNPRVRPGLRNKATDVFAFGALMYTAYSGEAPYKSLNISSAAIANLLSAGDRPERPGHARLSDAMWRLINNCWDQQAARRPTIDTVVSRLRSCA